MNIEAIEMFATC